MSRRSELGNQGGRGAAGIIIGIVVGVLGGMIGGALVFAILPAATAPSDPIPFVEQDEAALFLIDDIDARMSNISTRLEGLEAVVAIPEDLSERLDLFDQLDAERVAVVEQGRRDIAGFQDEIRSVREDLSTLSESIQGLEIEPNAEALALLAELQTEVDSLAADLLAAEEQVIELERRFNEGQFEDLPPILDIELPIFPLAELLVIENITFLDVLGGDFPPQAEVATQIQADVINIHSTRVEFGFLVRVIDLDRGSTVSHQSLLVNLFIEPGAVLKPAVRWTPPTTGNYLIQIFTFEPSSEVTLSVMATLRVSV